MIDFICYHFYYQIGMHDLNQRYTTPIKRLRQDDFYNSQHVNRDHQQMQYRTHQHLHKNIYLNALTNTPSTIHTANAAITLKQHIYQATRPSQPCPKEEPNHKHTRTNSKILSIKELKEEKARMHSRVASEISVKSSTNRKLFVTISKRNSLASQQKGVMLNSEQLMWENSSRGIKLTKYLELRSAEKGNVQ